MLTPSERRGIVIVALLFMIGSLHDLWRMRTADRISPPPAPTSFAAAPDSAVARTKPARDAEPTPPSELRIDLNRASPGDLVRVPGIGPVIAGRIVAHRAQHGSFRRIEDLLAVRGIGPRLLERLDAHVVVMP